MTGVAHHRFDNAKRRRPDHHVRQAMLTPSYVLEPIRTLMGRIGLDPCTEHDNPTRADTYYCLPEDGAVLPWGEDSIFCNPPYGEAKDRWVERCCAEATGGKRIALLLPAHPETQTFHRALRAAETVLLIRARLRFGVLRQNGRQEAASHGSALFGFNLDLSGLDPQLGCCVARTT